MDITYIIIILIISIATIIYIDNKLNKEKLLIDNGIKTLNDKITVNTDTFLNNKFTTLEENVNEIISVLGTPDGPGMIYAINLISEILLSLSEEAGPIFETINSEGGIYTRIQTNDTAIDDIISILGEDNLPQGVTISSFIVDIRNAINSFDNYQTIVQRITEINNILGNPTVQTTFNDRLNSLSNRVTTMNAYSIGANRAIKIGDNSGRVQDIYALAIGKNAGNCQGANAIAIGLGAGSRVAETAITGYQTANAIAIGTNAGSFQGESAIAIGTNAGEVLQQYDAIAIGANAGKTQHMGSIAIGSGAGANQLNGYSIAIGKNTGNFQDYSSIAIGENAGACQGSSSISIGSYSGADYQKENSIAIGYSAGGKQESYSVSIGFEAGATCQGTGAIAVGFQSGQCNQGSKSIAIGYQSGKNGCKDRSILLGNTITNINNGSLMINTSDTPLTDNISGRVSSSGFFIKGPIRQISRAEFDALGTNKRELKYNYTTGEILSVDI